MKTNAHPLLTRLSSSSMVAAAIIAFLACSPCRAEKARLYTNADLDALPAPQNRTESVAAPAKGKTKTATATWKEPLPTQSAPVMSGPAPDWDAVYAFIARERAAEARRMETPRVDRFEDCFYGNCESSIYRPGYLVYPGLITRRHCLPCDVK